MTSKVPSHPKERAKMRELPQNRRLEGGVIDEKGEYKIAQAYKDKLLKGFLATYAVLMVVFVVSGGGA